MGVLIDLFSNAQQGSTEDVDAILLRFKPIIQKYGQRLHDEDYNEELNVFVINFIKTVDLRKFERDPQLVNY